jgi:hypothetical protein
MKVEVHTIRYGAPDWLLACAPTLDSWTQRNGYPLRIWTMEDNKPEYPCLKFCEIDMWRQFLDGDSDWCIYVDGDIYVRHDAPELDFLGTDSRMYIPRAARRMNGRFPWWCRKYGVTNIDEIIQTLIFRNAGWWLLDRASAEKMLRVISPPYIEATYEECQFHYWLFEATTKYGLCVESPPRGWVNYHWYEYPSWMWHLSHQHGKMEALMKLRSKGKV